MSGNGKNIIQHFKKLKTYDGLAIGALALNIFAVYTTSNIRDFQELLEPMANQEIMVIQASAIMACLYLIEYFGDSEGSSDNMYPTSSNDEGFVAMISGFMEAGFVGEIVDAASIGVVFLGYSYLSGNASYGTSITEISTNPEVIAMQVSVIMMVNFGIVLVSDLLSKSNN
ncbi:MAG: hypothetical protein R6V35_03820 [Candidatus Nanohaloarchaea archaeon]